MALALRTRGGWPLPTLPKNLQNEAMRIVIAEDDRMSTRDARKRTGPIAVSGSRAASSVAAAIVFAWMVLAPAGSALAHGGPEKVVDGRFVVTLALAPTVGGTRLQFFFRDFASGRLVTEPVS